MSFEISLFEPEVADYVHIDENGNFHLLLPFATGESMSLDNTCKLHKELKRFLGQQSDKCGKSAETILQEYKTALELDIALLKGVNTDLVAQKTKRLQQVNAYLKMLKEVQNEWGINATQTKAQFPKKMSTLLQRRTNCLGVRFSPRVEDPRLYAESPIFEMARRGQDHEDFSRRGIEHAGLGPQIRKTVVQKLGKGTLSNPQTRDKIKNEILNSCKKLSADDSTEENEVQSNSQITSAQRVLSQHLQSHYGEINTCRSLTDGRLINLAYLKSLGMGEEPEVILDYILRAAVKYEHTGFRSRFFNPALKQYEQEYPNSTDEVPDKRAFDRLVAILNEQLKSVDVEASLSLVEFYKIHSTSKNKIRSLDGFSPEAVLRAAWDQVGGILWQKKPNIFMPMDDINDMKSAEAQAENISNITQFFLAQVALYCRENGLLVNGEKNLGAVFDQESHRERIADIVVDEIIAKGPAEDKLLDYISSLSCRSDLGLRKELTTEQRAAIKEQFYARYSIFALSSGFASDDPHDKNFDEFFIFLPEKQTGDFFTHSNRISVHFVDLIDFPMSTVAELPKTLKLGKNRVLPRQNPGVGSKLTFQDLLKFLDEDKVGFFNKLVKRQLAVNSKKVKPFDADELEQLKRHRNWLQIRESVYLIHFDKLIELLNEDDILEDFKNIVRYKKENTKNFTFNSDLLAQLKSHQKWPEICEVVYEVNPPTYDDIEEFLVQGKREQFERVVRGQLKNKEFKLEEFVDKLRGRREWPAVRAFIYGLMPTLEEMMLFDLLCDDSLQPLKDVVTQHMQKNKEFSFSEDILRNLRDHQQWKEFREFVFSINFASNEDLINLLDEDVALFKSVVTTQIDINEDFQFTQLVDQLRAHPQWKDIRDFVFGITSPNDADYIELLTDSVDTFKKIVNQEIKKNSRFKFNRDVLDLLKAHERWVDIREFVFSIIQPSSEDLMALLSDSADAFKRVFNEAHKHSAPKFSDFLLDLLRRNKNWDKIGEFVCEIQIPNYKAIREYLNAGRFPDAYKAFGDWDNVLLTTDRNALIDGLYVDPDSFEHVDLLSSWAVTKPGMNYTDENYINACNYYLQHLTQSVVEHASDNLAKEKRTIVLNALHELLDYDKDIVVRRERFHDVLVQGKETLVKRRDTAFDEFIAKLGFLGKIIACVANVFRNRFFAPVDGEKLLEEVGVELQTGPSLS